MPVILPSRVSRTVTLQGNQPPSGSGRYWPHAGDPLASTRTSFEPAHSWPGPSIQPTMSRSPRSHRSYGGIDSVASSCSSAVSAAMS